MVGFIFQPSCRQTQASVLGDVTTGQAQVMIPDLAHSLAEARL